MSYRLKRAKTEVAPISGGGAPSLADEEDASWAIAAFLAPSAKQHAAAAAATAAQDEEEEESPPVTPTPANDAPMGDARSEEGSAQDSLHLSKKRTPQLPSPPGKAEKGARKRARFAADAEADAAAVAAAAAAAKTKKHKKAAATTQRLGYMSQHGFLNSSLPLLSELTRERLLEHDLPSAAHALQQLFPAFRLDSDTVFKASIEVLEAAAREQGEQQNQNQLTRFYRKITNLQPKNLIQVVFELSYLFLSAGHLQESFDHLSTWTQSHFFTNSKAAVHEAPQAMQHLQGLLGAIAWECAKQAKVEADLWQRRLQRRQDGDSDDDESVSSRHGGMAHAHSHTLSQNRAQSTSDLLLELRTCQQKQLSFEKIARTRLRAAVSADPAHAVWLWYYLDCMHHFYITALPIDVSSTVGATLGPGSAAAALATAKHRAASNRAKLVALQQRLLRKIDEFIVASSVAPPGAPASFIPTPIPTGFHLKLHYMDLFRVASSVPNGDDVRAPTEARLLPPMVGKERQMAWTMVRQLLLIDPVSNIALERAWTMWRDQGEKEEPLAGEEAPLLDLAAPPAPSGSSVASAVNSTWCIRSNEMVDMLATRLDHYPGEQWSWHILARLLATSLGYTEETTPVLQWPLAGETPAQDDDLSSVRSEVHPAGHQAPVDPNMSDSERSVSSISISSSTAALRRKRLLFPPLTPAAAAAPAPSHSEPSSPALSAIVPDSPSSSAMGLPPVRALSAASSVSSPSGAQSQAGGSNADDLNAKPLAVKVFVHNLLSGIRERDPTDLQRLDAWRGRIEWWVQADGWWRDLKQIRPAQAPLVLPVDPIAHSIILRGVCYGLVLQWMGWAR